MEPDLVAGGGGVFDVVANGTRIFSKHESGGFPDEDELLATLQSTAEGAP